MSAKLLFLSTSFQTWLGCITGMSNGGSQKRRLRLNFAMFPTSVYVVSIVVCFVHFSV